MKKILIEFLKIAIFFGIVIGLAFYSLGAFNNVEETSYTKAVEEIKSGNVEKVVISGNSDNIVFSKNGKQYSANIVDGNKFLEEIKEIKDNKHVEIIKKPKKVMSFWDITYIVIALFLVLFTIIPIFMIRKKVEVPTETNTNNGPAQRVDEGEMTNKKLQDVAGIDEEKAELEEIVDFLKNPEKYTKMGARIPKGVLLVGRPGTGKTLLAKALAGEAKVPFYTISGSDFVELYVGVGAARVRKLFEVAKRNSPSIIFIDEIDAVGRQRGAGLGQGHDEREQTLNQLLVEMDGFDTNECVIVLAATNRPDILDAALLRPGRFDRQIYVPLPDAKGREQILKVHAKGKNFAPDIDFSVIAKNTVGYVGADLENILNEAALLAARYSQENITMSNVEEAMIKVGMGPEKKSRVIPEKERRLVSYHEAGHAVVSYFLPTQQNIHEISIIPRGMAGGYTMYKPTDDKNYISKKEMEENIISLLGGRIAEEIVIGDISTGASNDIERVSKIAKSMVTKYGMSKVIGTINYGDNEQAIFLGRDISSHNNVSEKTASIIDDEIKKIVDEGYRTCYEILTNNVNKLHAVANLLMEKEKITGEEFELIMSQENNASNFENMQSENV